MTDRDNPPALRLYRSFAHCPVNFKLIWPRKKEKPDAG